MKHHYLKKKIFTVRLCADYAHTKRVWKDFELKKIRKISWFVWNMCIKIYELVPAKFPSAPGLAWRASLKKGKAKIDLLTDIDMLLMLEKRIRGGICHAIHRYAKGNNKYMKDYEES